MINIDRQKLFHYDKHQPTCPITISPNTVAQDAVMTAIAMASKIFLVLYFICDSMWLMNEETATHIKVCGRHSGIQDD
jgi:hypothetical protein